ncbi:thioredoxin-like 3-3 [Phtheirospermum japonicum]|uniref:Thioredoxin-like 3-3 n=1 Tax=Phtheirospermum japonicum TaxID=374723 RepID=A0A830BR49_9LAMI|nr:thioredoxin-like 3-3 [Phtheirospermum japonicum]
MSEGCSTSACNEVEDTNHQDALPDYANLSKPSEHNENGDGNGIEDAPGEEDEDEDADFNPFLKENNSVEASSSLSSEVEDLDANVADSVKEMMKQTTVSSEEVFAATTDKDLVLVTQSEIESGCEKENGPTSVMDATDFEEPMLDVDSDGAICMRTRARYSLASFTLDELETFLQESDDEDDLQNVDDEEEYRKFLAGVLRGDDSQNLTGNVNADDEDEDNDADFELELEEALESEPEEVEERRMTRRNRSQKAPVERSKKVSGKSNRPLRPLLPFASIQSFPAPNVTPSYTPPVNNGVAFGFTAHQIGQLHCLIHEHVQLLIQVFSLSVLEPVKNNIAAEVKELVVEMLRKRDQALEWRTVPYPRFCFFPPYIHPSVSDGIQKSLLLKDGNGDVHQDMRLPDELAGSSQTPECTSWMPYVCGPVLSVMDVAPLRLVGNYMDDVSSAVRAYERCQIEVGFESCSQKEPLFPLHNFSCSAESDDQGETENNPSDSSGVLCSSPGKQIMKKTMAGTLLEKAKNQPVARVPKEIAKLAQRFWPLFNPALYPHKPPPAALVTRVLFTDAEDELLALGLMEYNTDWKAIQQRFLPCKSRHQIFVRQKNRASSKSPENPIKAVRRMKNSPLTSEEMARIDVGLKRFKLDWISIWRSFVPYRDPSLLPRQWRIACGTQKSYKSDADKNAKRRLNQLKRKTSKPPSTGHSFSEKEGDNTDNAVDETNCGNNRVDKEDEAYVHEAFLADWRPDDNNVSSSILNFMPSHDLTIHPQISSKSPSASSSQPVLRPYRARRQNNARVVKLAPDLPPLNLPPSVRVMSQSSFKSSQAVAPSKISSNASRIADLAGSSAKSGPYNISATSQHPNHSDLQMHPLLFQAPQNGQLPYYPVNCTSSRSSSFNFFPGKQPQLSLGLFHNPRHIRDAVNFLSKSSNLPDKNASSSSSSFGVDFHPLLQRSDDVDTHSVAAAHPARSTRAISTPPVDGSSESASGKKVASSSGKANELDLDMRLSFASKKNQKAAKNKNSGDVTPVTSRNKGSRKVSETTCDESLPEIIMEQEELSDSEEEEFGENVEFECEEMADSDGDSLSESEQILNIPNKEEQRDEMDADIDDARVLNTQTDNNNNNNHNNNNNNTCSTLDGQLGGLESTEGVNNINPNVSSLNLNSCPSISPLSNPNNGITGYEFGPFGATGMLGQNQPPVSSSKGGSSRRINPGPGDTLPRNPRKRVCRSKSNPSVVAGSGKGSSSPSIDTSVEKLKNVS